MRSPARLADRVVKELHIGFRVIAVRNPLHSILVLVPDAGIAYSARRLVSADVDQIEVLLPEVSIEVIEFGAGLSEVTEPFDVVGILHPAREIDDAAVIRITGQTHRQVTFLAVPIKEIVLKTDGGYTVADYAFFFGKDGQARKEDKREEKD